MKHIIIIAGYTKSKHIDLIRDYFRDEKIVLACAYTRTPTSPVKQSYLQKFDLIFNLRLPSDRGKIEHLADKVWFVTCTQERDMGAYIQALTLSKKITPAQSLSYTQIINKKTFKEILSESHKELVPKVAVVDDSLLQRLESLSYPQVIKPSGLAGSTLIKIVYSPEEFKAYYTAFAERMREIGTEYYEKEIEIITEEHISGPQYSVNVYIDKNQNITFCPLSRVITPQEVGENDSYSAIQYITNELSEELYADLQNAVTTVVKCFNIRNTSAHFDSVLHGTQWKFFEVGLRIGGKRQELYELSHGMDHFKNDILNRMGNKITIPEQKNTVAIVQKAADRRGILKRISYTRNIEKEKPPLIKESKMTKIGSEVLSLSEGGGTIARFFIWGKDNAAVIDESKKLFSSVKFEIE